MAEPEIKEKSILNAYYSKTASFMLIQMTFLERYREFLYIL